MNRKNKVIVGLSGGVDSSVAALLLKQQGYDVTGVTMSLWSGENYYTGKHSCFGPGEDEEIREAREIAMALDIPFHVFDCSKRYREIVLENFRLEYLSGRTPNPCIKCNQLIKFGMLPDLAKMDGMEFDYFATGHYARVEWQESTKRYRLRKGIDPVKDQSYFLYRLSQEQLSHILFPLGELTKREVRQFASGIMAPLAEKEESQDFYSGDYKELFDIPEAPGDIVNTRGQVLGQHKGIWNYTVGQRKGLGIAWTEPLYVTGLNKEKNQVVVGIQEDILSSSFLVEDLNWIDVNNLVHPIGVNVKIRSAQKEKEALVEPYEKGNVKVTFHRPNDSIAPGQSAVFYEDDIVIGGGIIKSVN